MDLPVMQQTRPWRQVSLTHAWLPVIVVLLLCCARHILLRLTRARAHSKKVDQ